MGGALGGETQERGRAPQVGGNCSRGASFARARGRVWRWEVHCRRRAAPAGGRESAAGGGALRGRGQHVREAPQVGGPEAQRRRTLRFAQDSSQCSVSSRGRRSFTSGSPRFLLRAEVSGKHVWRILRLKASMGVPVPTGPYGGREGMRPPYSRPGASGSGKGAGKAGKGDKTPVLT